MAVTQFTYQRPSGGGTLAYRFACDVCGLVREPRDDSWPELYDLHVTAAAEGWLLPSRMWGSGNPITTRCPSHAVQRTEAGPGGGE